MNDNKEKPKPRFPTNVTDRSNRKGEKLGFTSFPSALMYADLGLTSDEILVAIAIYDHYRKPGDKPWCSQGRLGAMAGMSRHRVGRAINRMANRALAALAPHGRGYAIDLSPLMKKMVEVPLKELPDARNEEAWEKDQEIARLKAKVTALTRHVGEGREPEPTGVAESGSDTPSGTTIWDSIPAALPAGDSRARVEVEDDDAHIDACIEELSPKTVGPSITLDHPLDEFNFGKGIDGVDPDEFIHEFADPPVPKK